MVKKRTSADYLKVIKGSGKASAEKRSAEPRKKPLNIFLIFLALFLLVQVLFSWFWGNAEQGAINTVLAGEGVADVSFPAAGVITFAEKVILAPCSGFVYYKVAGGERVPAGKEVAVISAYPAAETTAAGEEAGLEDYLAQFKNWFLGETEQDVPDSRSRGEAVKVLTQFPGLVKLEIDGFEKFGPQTCFPYLTAEEFAEKTPDNENVGSGERVPRAAPLLKLIDNYYWYFSAILAAEQEKLLADEPETKLVFSFAPEIPVWGQKVESRARTDGQTGVTWCMDRELPDLFAQRLCSADVVYKNLKGTLIPKCALLEIDGQKGVYVLKKGLVAFQEIIVLLEKEDEYLIKNLEPEARVFTEPEKMQEGQRFYW